MDVSSRPHDVIPKKVMALIGASRGGKAIGQPRPLPGERWAVFRVGPQHSQYLPNSPRGERHAPITMFSPPHQDYPSFSSSDSSTPSSSPFYPAEWCPERGGPVARRNERERKRVKLVNMGFAKLRQYIPTNGRPGKRLSKVETLRSAIDYIRQLRQILRQPQEPPFYYHPPPPQRYPQGYMCDYGCPCNEGMVTEYGYDGSTEFVMPYGQETYVM
ncbi:hypothetical protein JTE90_027622 [Oedothorax gibbosus]|uniref:BHLH domain-containing protein n=1 Tax=Oedothorax gibbosus TaxID=931172 RepID=A0AAV6VL44_9ARAC|nr:hypothetical protein JTE90_027622 [Oedothorax gibbosus]